MCYTSNHNYLYRCRRCEVDLENKVDSWTKEQGPLNRPIYRGESSRTMYTRALGHLTKYRAKDNFMWDHTRDMHDGILGPENGQGDYQMEFESRQKTSFARQIRESVLIKRNEEGKDREFMQGGTEKVELKLDLMNGRGEWFAPKCVEVLFHQW